MSSAVIVGKNKSRKCEFLLSQLASTLAAGYHVRLFSEDFLEFLDYNEKLKERRPDAKGKFQCQVLRKEAVLMLPHPMGDVIEDEVWVFLNVEFDKFNTLLGDYLLATGRQAPKSVIFSLDDNSAGTFDRVNGLLRGKGFVLDVDRAA